MSDSDQYDEEEQESIVNSPTASVYKQQVNDKKLPYSKMVDDAIRTLNEKTGTSLPALKKFINMKYNLSDEAKSSLFIKKYLKSAIEKGHLKFGKTNMRYKFSDKDLKPKKPKKKVKKVAAAVKEADNKIKKDVKKIKNDPKKVNVKLVIDKSKQTKQKAVPKTTKSKETTQPKAEESSSSEEDTENEISEKSSSSEEEVEDIKPPAKPTKRKLFDTNNNELETKKVKSIIKAQNSKTKEEAKKTIPKKETKSSVNKKAAKIKPRKSIYKLNHSLGAPKAKKPTKKSSGEANHGPKKRKA